MKEEIKNFFLYFIGTFVVTVFYYKFFGGFHSITKGYDWKEIIKNIPEFTFGAILVALFSVSWKKHKENK